MKIVYSQLETTMSYVLRSSQFVLTGWVVDMSVSDIEQDHSDWPKIK